MEQRKTNPIPNREYIIMNYLEGENLGYFWEDISWEDRKVSIILL